jgi:lactate permease
MRCFPLSLSPPCHVAVLVLLAAFRRPAWQASLAGLIVGLIIAIGVWQSPIGLALNGVAAGSTFALWPVMWIVFNALLLYNVAVRSGRFDQFRDWVLNHLPNDRRVVLVVIGFCFGALLEGIAGFGTPVAITSSLLILVGYPPLEALVFTLIFNTAPVAFGALGVPITVLGVVTHQSDTLLGAMVGRQLPFFALCLPFYVMGIYGGMRSVRALWPVLLVAGGSFAVAQFVTSNFINYTLTDVLSSMTSLIVTLLFLQVSRPKHDPKFAVRYASALHHHAGEATWEGWLPWIVVSVTVIVWTSFRVFLIGDLKFFGPACTTRFPSRSTTTRPTRQYGISSRSALGPQFCWPPLSPLPWYGYRCMRSWPAWRTLGAKSGSPS